MLVVTVIAIAVDIVIASAILIDIVIPSCGASQYHHHDDYTSYSYREP